MTLRVITENRGWLEIDVGDIWALHTHFGGDHFSTALVLELPPEEDCPLRQVEVATVFILDANFHHIDLIRGQKVKWNFGNGLDYRLVAKAK